MKRLIRWALILSVLGAAGWAAAEPGARWYKERTRILYREVEVTRGRIVAVVNATGTVKPVRSVTVGSFVSGPILKVFVEHNDIVSEAKVLAKIDPKIYEAAVARDRAVLATRVADVARVRAQLQQASNNEVRARALRKESRDYLSDAEMDQYRFARAGLAAELKVSETAVDQAKAGLDRSLADLDYTNIIVPKGAGGMIVLDRKIDPGQTVAASFQTPELFILADLRLMHIFASVDESDIGAVHRAQSEKQPVRFTVDSYPDDLFSGTIYQVRQNSTTTQNVVTYPVVVEAKNPDFKLKPGMTANLSFQVREVTGVLRVPNAALRFYPQREQVRPEDHPLLESKATPGATEEAPATSASAEEKAELRRRRHRRHVWVQDGELLRAIEVVTGASNNQYTELISGEVVEGQKLVTGIEPRN